MLSLKKLTPVRLLKNPFQQRVAEAEAGGATEETLSGILGRGRAKLGMWEGDLTEGELEIGQVSALIRDIVPAGELLHRIRDEFRAAVAAPFYNG